METGINRGHIVNELGKSVHGKLEEYQPIVAEACRVDPEFVAHMIAWDFVNGEVKDTKVALPVITLGHKEFPDELVENSLAHLSMQPARELLKALRFSIESNVPARRQKRFERMIKGWLEIKERVPEKWMRQVARQRRAWKELYALTHKPAPYWVTEILFRGVYAPGGIFADIKGLSVMPEKMVAGTIAKWHLSPLTVAGAMTGAKAKLEDTSVVLAGMKEMTGNEMLNRAKKLGKRAGGNDEVREGMRAKVADIAKVHKAKKVKTATLKAGVAAEEVEDDGLKTMLKELQERQIEQQKEARKGIDGNWLVIGDKSGSQEHSIEMGKQVAATIAKFVSGKVGLIFCNTGVDGRDVTGLSLDAIKELTKYTRASGGTSYGIGLEWGVQWGIQAGVKWDGVVIVGDGAENHTPLFHSVYASYAHSANWRPPVYLYKTASTEHPINCMAFENRMAQSGFAMEVFDVTRGQVDYYSLPNLVQQMNVNRFSLVDKIMACPLVKFEQVLAGYTERMVTHA